MKLAIVGSRSINKVLAETIIENFLIQRRLPNPITCIISGGAAGVDKAAETVARNLNIEMRVIRPNWSLGRHAGMVRNTDIIQMADIVLAIWDGKSKGTKNSIDTANQLNKLSIIKIIEV
jgi:hypothetical protein